MAAYKTPGVYIEEINSFPGSVVQVSTAIPAFIGYTEKTKRNGKSLFNLPTRISSFAEFVQHFGTAAKSIFEVNDLKTCTLKSTRFYLYHSIQLFYLNGGGACYITSVGGFDKGINKEVLTNPISAADSPLDKENEPTMIVIPDALGLGSASECYDVYKIVLEHCNRTQNRIGIFDVFNGYSSDKSTESIDFFRNNIGNKYLSFSAAYYPWVNASVVEHDSLTFKNIDNGLDAFEKLSKDEGIDDRMIISELFQDYRSNENKGSDAVKYLHNGLLTHSPTYKELVNQMVEQSNILPVASIMAGIMTGVDNSRGVWKAPANVGLNYVVKPTVDISHSEQENLNVDALTGKSINAIRSFPGVGTLVWGARTLDGNSLDWRYVNVRRTMIMLEQSIKLAFRGFAFEPNTANTWVKVKAMVENFLTEIWKKGGLAGAIPNDAFDVQVGFGSTMNDVDILEGKMIVSVKVAVVRPAEFIILRLEQQMQKS